MTYKRILKASLGYSVLLGIGLFGERLRPWQWVAVALAAGGVLNLLRVEGRIPWVGLTPAFFGSYGAVRKKVVVEYMVEGRLQRRMP
ncbi:MAG: hypothetical protein R3310_03375 [Candidatus Competibacteraceae bacterium]|nr:hypothetical protein [Candidatus Competibacteraceae bacterium]